MSDKFEQLKRKYISSFIQKQEDLKGAWEDQDIERLEGLLHKLTGSSGSYGFNELTVLCRNAIDFIDEFFVVTDKNKSDSILKEMFGLFEAYSS